MLVPLHTPPNEAVAEIDALYDVYLKIIDKWQTDVSSWVPQGEERPCRLLCVLQAERGTLIRYQYPRRSAAAAVNAEN